MVEDIKKALNKGVVLKLKDLESGDKFKTKQFREISIGTVLSSSTLAEESGILEGEDVAVRTNQWTKIDEDTVYVDYAHLLWICD